MMEELRKNRKELRRCKITRLKVLLFMVNVFVFETIIMKLAELFNWSAILESAPILKAILLATAITGGVWKFWDKLKESILIGIISFYGLAGIIDYGFISIAIGCFNITNWLVLFLLTVVSFWIAILIMFGVQHITQYVRERFHLEEDEMKIREK